uniref:Uncharacterized protein n=1 Tax=Oncorhynchus tshawytscha TaxID=74940 RepID=A0A8C8CLJ3_ONCTS
MFSFFSTLRAVHCAGLMGVSPLGRLSLVDWPLLGSDRSLTENGVGRTFVAELRDDPFLDLAGRTGRHVTVHCGSRGRHPPLSELSAVTGFMNGLPKLNSFALGHDVLAPSCHAASIVRLVEVRNTRTICFSGAKVLDLSEVMPTIKKQIPALKTCFSHLWSLHQWLMSLTKDLGKSFVNNFESSWNMAGYFVEDGIHLGENGSRLLRFRTIIVFTIYW